MSEQRCRLRRWAAGWGFCALAWAVCFAPNASATAELDRKYALESVGALRAWDNVDGLFADYVAAAYQDYFSRQSRFVLQDLSKADALFSRSKLPYHKLIEDAEILGQLARATRTQSMVRTRVSKEGAQYRFSLQWLHSPQMDLLASEELILKEASGSKALAAEEIKRTLQHALDRLIAKVPFRGTVTGRDNTSVTVNIGSRSELRAGDTLVIGTLDDVKKHPLLKEVVEWRLAPTGKVLVEQVDEAMAFGRVIEEEPGRQLGRYQKVVRVLPRVLPLNPPSAAREAPEPAEAVESAPSLGWTAITLWSGSYGRSFSDTSASLSGSGLVLGTAASGQLWLTRDWFAEMSLGYGFWSYSQENELTGATMTGSRSGNAMTISLAAGYSYLVTGDFFGPKAWTKFGFRSNAVSLPAEADNRLAPNSFKTPFIGIGGDLPIRSHWGALLDFEFGIFSSGTETGGVAGSMTSASDAKFFVGGYYRMGPRMTIRAGLDVLANAGDFASGAAMSQKIITFSPSLLYYF
ncbi:MAG: PorT family protein [Oligoflexia bacterium]|nr:PorT family protein [Oligoflexia bacterium]